MQQILGLKSFAFNHFGGAALAFGIVVSSLTVAATLSVTSDFPGLGHAESAYVSTSGSPLGVAAAMAEQRQLRMDRDDFVAWRRQTASVVAISSTNATANAQRRELLMERAEYFEWRQRLTLPSAAAST